GEGAGAGLRRHRDASGAASRGHRGRRTRAIAPGVRVPAPACRRAVPTQRLVMVATHAPQATATASGEESPGNSQRCEHDAPGKRENIWGRFADLVRILLSVLRILIVDDDPTLRGLFALMLERRGHTVATAADPAEAQRHCLASPIDVVAVDMLMPH